MRVCRPYLRVLVLAALLLPQICDGQSTTSPTMDTSRCQAIAAGDAQERPLSKVCEFALTYRRSLPDFVCGQTTTLTGPHSIAVVEAEVTFENGQERYSKVTTSIGAPRLIRSPALSTSSQRASSEATSSISSSRQLWQHSGFVRKQGSTTLLPPFTNSTSPRRTMRIGRFAMTEESLYTLSTRGHSG